MSKKFWYLTKVSLNKKIKTKWFFITNAILAIIIIALLNINSIITFFGGDFDNKTNIVVIDNNTNSYNLLENNINSYASSLGKDNEDLKLKLLLFSKISELSKDRIDFLLSIIDSFKFLK